MAGIISSAEGSKVQGFAILIVMGVHEWGPADVGESPLSSTPAPAGNHRLGATMHDTAMVGLNWKKPLLGGYLRDAVYSVLGMFHF